MSAPDVRNGLASAAVGFFFTGTAVLPPLLAYTTDPALGAIAFVFLVIAGAVSGIADPDAPHNRAGDGSRPPD